MNLSRLPWHEVDFTSVTKLRPAVALAPSSLQLVIPDEAHQLPQPEMSLLRTSVFSVVASERGCHGDPFFPAPSGEQLASVSCTQTANAQL